MRLAFIGTYPPRQCGIATFTNNLIKSIVANCTDKNIASNAYVIAMNDAEGDYAYPEEVRFTIEQEQQQDYVQAANFINASDAEACVLEHEYGIFGGDNGIYILPLIYRLEIPLIVTLHTVLREPTPGQKHVVREFGVRAQKIIVMSQKAVKFLTEIYKVPREKISIIEHGVPDIDLPPQEKLKEQYNFNNKKILFTFGLLGRSKGLETTIKALPKVVEKHPELQYMILGNTHPAIIKHEGEAYRNSLMLLAKRLGVKENVIFNKKFVSEKKLFEYLSAIDIYITPYLNEAQITSGTLSYAIGAGAAVVSTPYWHAQELLAEERGRLFDFGDHEKLSEILIELLDDREKLNQLRKNAFNYGLNIRWPKVGKQYLDLAKSLQQQKVELEVHHKPIIDPLMLPPFSLDHVTRLTDDTGIVQYAKFGVPNLKSGYSLDDNARALFMCTQAYQQSKDPEALKLMPVYLSYIQYMQRENGTFRNLLSFNREYLDKEGSEDSFGRTVLSLGFLYRFAPSTAYRKFAKMLFDKARQNFDKLMTLRGNAYALSALYHFTQVYPDKETPKTLIDTMATKLLNSYNQSSDKNWQWFEDYITYDNGILPAALLFAYDVTKNKSYLNTAEIAMDFLASCLFNEGILMPAGNQGWYPKHGSKAIYAQESADVMSMVRMYFIAYQITNTKDYLNKMFNCHLWYLGQNMLQTSLYDHESNGCSDGIEKDGINLNQGAEATLAYLISHLTVMEAHSKEF